MKIIRTLLLVILSVAPGLTNAAIAIGSHVERSEAWAGGKAHASHEPLTVATEPGISRAAPLGWLAQ